MIFTMVTAGALQSDRGIGRSNGVGGRPFDRWFRYPAGFSDDTMRAAFDAARVRRGSTIVDCFAGVATTGVHAMGAGRNFIGIEGSELIADLARLKTSEPDLSGADLRLAAAAVATGIEGASTSGNASEHELLQRCFAPAALAQLTLLRSRVSASDARTAPYLRWGLLGSLRPCASVKTGWPYQLPAVARRSASVSATFIARCEAIASDIDSRQLSGVRGLVINGDSRASTTWAEIGTESVHACITSPPYLNNYDYLDALRLELYFLGAAGSWSDLLTSARRDLVTATTHHASSDLAAAAIKHLDEIGARSVVEPMATQLAAERRRRPRGKEYDDMLVCYASDLAKVLANLRGALKRRGRAVFVVGDSAPYGVYVNTPGLIAQLGQVVGLTQEADVLLRERGLRWRTNGTRHQVGLAERMITLRRP